MQEPKTFHSARSLSHAFIHMPFQCVRSGKGARASQIRAEEFLWLMSQGLKVPQHIAFSIAVMLFVHVETESAAKRRPVVCVFSRVGFVYWFPSRGGGSELKVFVVLDLLALPLFVRECLGWWRRGVRRRRVG